MVPYGCTDGRTKLVVKSLSRLKTKINLTDVKTPSLVFLLIIWTTPMTVPLMHIGMHRIDLNTDYILLLLSMIDS